MDGLIQPLPSERVVSQAKPRDGTRHRDPQRESKPFELTPPPPQVRVDDANDATTEPHEAHPPCEDGVGLRLDVTA